VCSVNIGRDVVVAAKIMNLCIIVPLRLLEIIVIRRNLPYGIAEIYIELQVAVRMVGRYRCPIISNLRP
jgi:hypothetical protein